MNRLSPFHLVSRKARAMATSVHNVAVSGFAEGTNDHYDKVRPSYPASALSKIHTSLPRPIDPGGLSILEPGAGTGIFSRILLSPPTPEYPTFDLKSLIGVEPSSGMRKAWEKGLEKVPADRRGGDGLVVKAVEGSFDDFSKAGVEGGSVDAIIIAQAWHWCPDHDKALGQREIAKYLQPEGVLVLIWNLEYGGEGWHRKLRDTYEAYNKILDTPQYFLGRWRAMYETAAYKELFEPAEESTSVYDTPSTEDLIVDRLFSKSYLTEAHLHGEARKEFEQKVRKVVQEGDKEWIDKEKRVFVYKYNADVVVIKRKKN